MARPVGAKGHCPPPMAVSPRVTELFWGVLPPEEGTRPPVPPELSAFLSGFFKEIKALRCFVPSATSLCRVGGAGV